MKDCKCKLCGWNGVRTHMHHIIPKRYHGEDTKDNLIELCPNCHADATMNEKDFAIKHKLVGKKFSKDKIKALVRGSKIFCNIEILNIAYIADKTVFEEYEQINKKYGFNKYEYIAFIMGVTSKYVEDNYFSQEKSPVKVKQSINTQQREESK